jgi:hypothetical protein
MRFFWRSGNASTAALGRYAPPVHMIKQNQADRNARDTPYLWVHPNEDGRRLKYARWSPSWRIWGAGVLTIPDNNNAGVVAAIHMQSAG